MNFDFSWLVLIVPVFILAGSIHEYMHAWTAKRLGDFTATTQGRLTLNPLKHIDPWGFLLMITAGFGWMRPVPVNEYNFKHPVRDMAIVAAAGPASNVAMAILASLILRIFFPASIPDVTLLSSTSIAVFFYQLVYSFIYVNIVLALFNLIPIPPLDGSRMVRIFLPKSIRLSWDQVERYSIIFILLLFLPFSPLSRIVSSLLSSGIEILFKVLIF